MAFKDQWYNVSRLGGLRRFAVAITVLNVLGHTVLGFEQSLAQPLVSLAVTYSMALLLESIEAWQAGRRPRFAGGVQALVDFLLPAHISGLALAMLLYANDRLWPIAFGAAVVMGAKHIFRVPINGRSRHFFNPSNIGITVVLLLFPSVGIAPPYHFTEGLVGAGDWILPGIIIVTGSLLNARFTRRLPLLTTWLAMFALQGLVRALVFGTPILASWMPMTGLAFMLYTFYMITDPATTPSAPRDQVWFGASVGLAYACLMMLHVVFGLFFSLSIVCAVRGVKLAVQAWLQQRQVKAPAVPEVATVAQEEVAVAA